MISSHPLAGVYAAAVTPLRPLDGCASELELESVPALLRFLAERGCHGAALFGTTGEGPSFSFAEREALMRAAVAARDSLNNFRLIVGTGTPSLTETIELTKLTFDLGCDAALILPPYYFRKVADDGLFDWFSEVIRRAVPADKYIIGYHIPPLTGVGFSIELLRRLKDAFPSQFAGIKDSSHDINFAKTLGDAFGADLMTLNGTDSYLKFAMENHAAGCITAPANLISPSLRAIWDATRAGKDASETQARVSEQRRILEKFPPFPPILKALLHRKYGLPRWALKPPLSLVSNTVEEQALQELDHLLDE